MRVLKDTKRVIRLGLLGIVFCFVTAIVSMTGSGSASALSGGQSVGIQFTFNASLSVTFSSSELVIDNLTPGTYSKSNTISIDVQTNNRNGYTLTAEVGDSETPAYANNSLVNTISSTAFTSLSTSDNLTLSAFSPNSWGYTTAASVDSSSTYSGLLYNATTILNQTVDVNGNSTGKFKGTSLTNFTIGANAGVDQASGQYTNTISFAVVPNVSTDITIDSLQYMQNFPELTSDQVASVLSSMTPGQAYELKDRRDEESYHIAKLSDGKIWLLDNLRLDLSTTRNLTPSDTNISSNWTAPTEIATWPNNVYSAPKIATSGTGNNGDWTKDTLISYGSGSGKIGVYYNYCAATAGTYCYGSGAGTGDATYDICPVGWRMPAGGPAGEYQALYLAYGSNVTNFKNALRTPLSGDFDNGSASNQGSLGFFWSSTYYNSNDMYFSYVNSSNVYPQANDFRIYGFSVRCVLDGTIEYAVSYDKNTNDTVTSMPSSQSGTMGNGGNLTLPSNAPSRSGYVFLGWCPTQPTVSNGVDSCPGTTYQPNQIYFIDYNQARIDVTFYAMWEPKYTITLNLTGNATGITIDDTNYTTSVDLTAGTYTISGSYASGYEFSSWSASGSASVASNSSASTTLTVSGTGTLTLVGKQSCVAISGYLQNFTDATNYCTIGTLTDNRDGTSYTVGKLADGRWWLLDNLALDLTSSTVKANLSATNTNASDTTLNYLKNGGGTTSDQYATSGVATWTSANSYSAPLIATSGTGANIGNDWTKDTLRSYGSGSGKMGIYYNYCAASAGSYCYGDGTGEGSPSGNATEDICPKGWRMPTGGSSGEYQALYTAYSSNATNFKNALRTPLAGNFFSSDLGWYLDSNGGFWSSTYFSSIYMYLLSVNSSNVYPQYISDRSYGNSVRCVLQASDISQISTMQDFATNNATAIKNSMTTGQVYTLTDSRDGTSYTVSKLADGKVWLLDNLALDLTNTTVKNSLTASTTNASATTLNYLKNGGGTTSDQYATADVANWTSSYSYSAPLIATSGTGWTKDTLVPLAMGQSGSGKIGVYYNFCAASAGSYCYGNGTSSGSPSGNATEDICPAGWRMPTGGSSGEYQALLTAYSSDKATFVNALRTPLSGYFNNGSATGQGSYGYFWSSTRSDNVNMYGLSVGASNVGPQGSFRRYSGNSVRCITGA